uniref:Uncharacterized protein n=1 Tax=Rhizophora mucronata TaxID=61149 RepID=A0A2P2PP54_RHIMU
MFNITENTYKLPMSIPRFHLQPTCSFN